MAFDYSKWDKMEAELKREERKEEAEAERRALHLNPEIPKTFKDKGNELFKKNDLAEAVSAYTSCIIMLTGERDPRARRKKTPEELKAERDKREEEEKKRQEMRDRARNKDVKLPAGVTAVDPSDLPPEPMDREAPVTDPLQEMTASAFVDDIDDDQLELRMMKAQRRIQLQPELKELLAKTYSNRANCEFKLSEGKDEKFKEKVKGTSKNKVPGGADKWDNYKVRMTSDSLNDARAACILDPSYARPWYRVGACIERLIFLIDRIRDRKAWLKEEELPILDKPNMYKEAEESLRKSLELDPQPETHKLLVQIVEDMHRIPTFVRKMGHEKLCCDFDKRMVLTDVDEKGPSSKWGLGYYKGLKLLRVRVEKGGATARDYELRRDPVWVEVENLKHLIAEQTHASKVDLEFTYLEKPRQVASWDYYAPDGKGKAKPKEKEPVKEVASEEPSEVKRAGRGRPPPRQRGGGAHGPLLAGLGLAFAIFALLGILVFGAFGSGGGGGEL
eukprot:Hpha_TRINITY_DN15756_c4_g5::TRINITY_DN15756_c4_g5_i1::g.39937::m.39937